MPGFSSQIGPLFYVVHLDKMIMICYIDHLLSYIKRQEALDALAVLLGQTEFLNAEVTNRRNNVPEMDSSTAIIDSAVLEPMMKPYT